MYTIYISDLFEARVRRVKTENVPATAAYVATTPGLYYLKAITTENRMFDSAPFEVIGIPPRPASIVGKAIVKKGAIVKFTVNAPVANAQYNWTLPADAET